MAVFLSSYVNGVDAKGRVSVPAAFRAELATHTRQQVVVYAAPDGQYLMGWGYDDFLKFAEKITRMSPLSPQRQRLARTLLAAARPLSFDDNGRIQLPENFIGHAQITDKAMFAGQGETFTIWNPAAFEAMQAADSAFTAEDLAALSTAWDTPTGGPHE
ncbi:MAG: division/cell wall cluster transcriptional repressor MraZ [Alphaproteobacteria bacterium]